VRTGFFGLLQPMFALTVCGDPGGGHEYFMYYFHHLQTIIERGGLRSNEASIYFANRGLGLGRSGDF